MARDAYRNGYLNEVLFPYWGEDAHVALRSTPYATIEAWLAVSTQADGRRANHAKRVKPRDADYLAKRTQFALLLPELERVVKTSRFVVPISRVDERSELPDLDSLTDLVSALTHYSDSLKDEARLEEAAEAVALSLAFTKIVFGNTMSLDMTAQQMQNVVFRFVVHKWNPAHEVPAAVWYKLSRALLEYSPSGDQFLLALQLESKFHEKVVNDILVGRTDLPDTLATLYFPGGADRERRLAQNFYTDMMEDAVRAPYSEALQLPHFSWPGWFTGRTGMVARLLSGYEEWKVDLNYHRLLMYGASVTLYLRGMEKELGELPKDLQSIDNHGFVWEPDVPRSFFKLDREEQVLVLHPPMAVPSVVSKFAESSDYESKSWIEVLPDRVVFRI